MSRRLVVALIVALRTGVRRASASATSNGRPSSPIGGPALSSPIKPSPRTVQTLRIYDLDHVYDRDPDDAIRKLHATAVADPQPDTLFALAELSYLRGQAVGKKHPDDAVRHYVRCCAYAQHYLLASSVEVAGGEAPASRDACGSGRVSPSRLPIRR